MASTKEKEKKDKKVKVDTKKKNTKKVEKKKVKKEGFFKGIKKEMGLVKWPTWKEVLKNTVATLVLVIVICGFFLILTLLLSIVKGWF